MKRIKNAIDPARPVFRHFFENGRENVKPWSKSVSEFLFVLARHHRRASFKCKIQTMSGAELIDIVPISGESLGFFFASRFPDEEDLFFCPLPIPGPNDRQLTWFGWCDTGRVHPGTFEPHPAAYWETSKGNYQAIWRWERGLPLAASSARVEAMIHEYGGKLGSHLPDAFLRVPGSINNGAACFPWPSVRMLYNALDPAILEAEDEATGDKLFV